MTGDGATVRFTSGGTYDVHATPAATTTPDVWLLGSSDYSAQLAAALGLPYVFANHFSGEGLDRALGLYRDQFRPSETLDAPRTFLTANAVVADSDAEAEAPMLPQARMMARLRGNRPLIALETVEEAAAAEATDHLAAPLLDALRSRWFVGTGPEAQAALAAFAAQHGVDEVMVSPVSAAHDGEQPDAAPARIRTLELLAA